ASDLPRRQHGEPLPPRSRNRRPHAGGAAPRGLRPHAGGAMTARFLDVSAEQYHSDPCQQPSLSVSIATELILRSPLHAWQIHPRLGGLRRPTTEAMSDGTLIHALLLGKGEDRIAVLDVENFRTKAAQEARDAAIAIGRAVVKATDYEEAKGIVETLKGRIAKYGVVFDGLSEQVIEWHEPTEEDGDVLCRAMLDHLAVRFSNVTDATGYDVQTISPGGDRTILCLIPNSA